MKKALIIGLLLGLASCCPKAYISKVVSDTTTHVRLERTQVFRDTLLYAPIPAGVEVSVTPLIVLQGRNGVRDTTSVLETSVATSTARIEGGVLVHTLQNKPASLPVVAQIKDTETRRDSTFAGTTEVTVVQEVFRQYWWQSALMWLGIATLAAIGIYLTIKRVFKW